jgi:HlyD family secretion protein
MKKLFTWLWKQKIYVIIILIIAGLIGFQAYKKANTGPDLIFDKVTRQTATEMVSESGNIQSDGQADVIAPIEGIVQQIFVTNGKKVTAGQALFSIQSTASDLERAAANSSLLAAQANTSSVRQAEILLGAALDTAKSQLFSAQNSYNIVSKGYHRNSTNPATDKTYKYIELQSAEASLAAAKTNLQAAQRAYDDAGRTISSAKAAEEAAQLQYDSKSTFTVRAASSGLISNIGINPGDKVSPAAQAANPAMIISRPSDQNNLIFKTQINENDITKLKVDQTATITIDAVKNKKITAKINSIDLIGTNTNGVITYNVYFGLTENDESMRPGMSGSADVEVARHENVLTVINAAVKPYQDGKAVQVIDQEQTTNKNKPVLKYIPVKVDIKMSDRTEITEGLTEGMDVVINNTGNQFKSSLFGG